MGKAKEIAELGDKITVSGGTVTVADISTSTFSGTSIHSMQDVDLTGIAHNMFLKYNLSNTQFEVVAGNTSSIDEGSNLYYTDARVASYLSSNDFDTATNIVASITDSAPSTLDTLNELAAALGDDPNFSTTVTNSIAGKVSKTGDVMSGNLEVGSNTKNSDSELIMHTSSGRWSVFSDYGTDLFGVYKYGTNAGRGLVINSDRNVGIGTNDPDRALHIEGSDFAGSTIRLKRTGGGANNDAGLQFQSAAGANADTGMGGIWFQNSLDGNAYALIRARTDDATGTSGRLDFMTSTSLVNNSSSPSLTIKSSGNVGIGTDSPADKMHIYNSSGTTVYRADVNSNSTVGFEINKTGSTTQSWKIADGITHNGALQFYDSTNSAVRIHLKSDGLIGIGTTSPLGTLHLHSADTAVRLTSSDGSNTPLAQLQYSGSGGYFLRMGDSSNNEDVMIRTYGNSHFNGGNVGIGTSSPGRLLTLFNDDQPVFQITNNTSGSASTNGMIFYQASGSTNHNIDNQGSGSGGDIQFMAAGSNTLKIQANGKVGIGTTSPDAKLEVSGNVKVGSAAHSSWTDSVDDVGGLDVFVGSGSHAFTVWDDNSQSAPRFIVERAGNVGIGNTDPTDKLTMTVGNGGGILQSTYYSGTVTSGQKLGVIGFKGYSQGNTVAGADAKIEAVAAGNHSGSSAPANLDFYTKPESIGPGSAAVLRHRIHEEGHQTIFKGTNNWSVQRHNNSGGCYVCHRLYGAGSSTTTYNLLRYRRHYWGSGSVKFTLSQTYYSSTAEGEYWLTGHGRSDGSYSPNYNLAYVDVYNGPGSGRLSLNQPGGSPGNSAAEIVDVSISIPAYYYYMVRVEVSHSEYYTTTSVMGSVNSFALFT